MKDKNAKVEDHEQGLRQFNLEEVLGERDQDTNAAEVNCVVRWGDRTVEGRRE